MNPQAQRKTIIASIAALAFAGGALLWWHVRSSIPEGDVASFLESTAGPGRVRFTITGMETVREDDAGRQVSVTAKARPVQPLYTKADAADYLQRTFQLDADSAAPARARLADKATAKNVWLTGGHPLPADPFLLTLLQPATPPEASFNFQGVLEAHRTGGRWSFSLVSGGLEAGGPQGDARSTFGVPSFVIGDAADDGRLRSIVADFQAFAGRVAQVRKDAEAARTRVVDARRQAFLARIAPGRFFSGTALEAGDQYGTVLYLEITSVSGNDVTAVLRNDGSWHNGRIFQGTWAADDDFRTTTLSLSSSAGQAVRNAGPFVETTQNWSLDLTVDASGRLSGDNKFFQYRFQPVPPAQVAAVRSRLEAEFEQAVAETEPGSLYQGRAASADTGASEPILLRIESRSDDGKSFEATIESTTHSWKRAFRGSIIDNARRSRGEPLRLASDANDAVVDAPVSSVLGDPDDLQVSLGGPDGALAGSDAHFTYRLARAEETDLHRLEAARAKRARHFMGILRAGIAYDGTLREDQGFITHARLEVTGIDRSTGAVTASIHSLARARVFREFSGTFDPSGGSISLSATSRGSFSNDGSFDVPFLTSPSSSTVHLELAGNSLKGRIEDDPHWVLEFPAGIFLSAPTEGAEPGSPPANGSVLPAFPTAHGAYLLSHGSWAALPVNDAHVIIETLKPPKEEAALPGNILGVAEAGLTALSTKKEKIKVTYLVFDGKELRPESGGQAMVILYVGPAPGGRGRLELAPTEVGKDGARRLEIPSGPAATPPVEQGEARQRSAPTDVRLGEQRLAAYIRGAGAGYTLFTTTSALAPGPYVFNADVPYELSQE